MKILIIEDEKIIADSLKQGLQQHNFTVDVAYSGGQGYGLINQYNYDVIILDLMLPDMKGEELCGRIRKEKIDSFVIMLTAKKQLVNIVDGLNCGADDYLTKPFEFSELLARIRALLRRSSENKQNKLYCKELEINVDTGQAFVDNKLVRLTRKEFMILEYFLRNQGQLLTRNQILEHAWDRNVDIFTNVVDTHIKNLRNKLGKSGKLIQTVYGSGYRIPDEDQIK